MTPPKERECLICGPAFIGTCPHRPAPKEPRDKAAEEYLSQLCIAPSTNDWLAAERDFKAVVGWQAQQSEQDIAALKAELEWCKRQRDDAINDASYARTTLSEELAAEKQKVARLREVMEKVLPRTFWMIEANMIREALKETE